MTEPAETAPPEFSRADLRRAQVLEAAAKCFKREGFHGASMASIAGEADMSVGQIYRDFANKEAVIAALVEQSMAQWAVRMAEVQARGAGPVEELMEIARLHAAKVGEGQVAALSLEFLAESARNPRIAEIMRGVDQTVRAELKSIVLRNGGADDDALGRRLNIIMMLLDGWTVRAVKDPSLDGADNLRTLRPLFEALLTKCGG